MKMYDRLTKEQRAEYMRDNGVAPKPFNVEYQKRRQAEALAQTITSRCSCCGARSGLMPAAKAIAWYRAHAKAGCR